MELSGRSQGKTEGHRTCLLCDPCTGENEDEPAVTYCTVCNEYLCHGCRKAHTKTTITKGHPLIDGTSMPKQKPTSGKNSMCPKHSKNPLEYYCKNDDQFSCSVCVTIDHKQCRVQYIDDIATNFQESNDYVALEKATADLIKLLQETKGTATRNMSGIASIHANFISDLQQFRSEINNTLYSLKNTAMTVAKIARDSDKKTVNSIATACDSMLSDIQMITSELAELSKYKQKRLLVICSKRAMKTVNTYDNRVNKLSNKNKIRDYKFKPNEEIHRFLNSLDTFGHMKESRIDEKTKTGSSTDEGGSSTEEGGLSRDDGSDSSISTYQRCAPTHVGNIEFRHSSDKFDCWITGGVIIDKTKLALVDHFNYSVTIVNLDTKTVTPCIKLHTKPWDITCVNQDQIVVTCYDRNKGKLVFLKVGISLSLVKELDIVENCRGIVYTNDTFFVTFDKPQSSVKAIDLNGTVLKTFKTNKDGSALFSNPENISLSTDQKTVFVSDWYNNIVKSLTLDGTVQHVFAEDSLKSPGGLAVDRNDNIYIAGYKSDNIHQVSTHGNRSHVILDLTDGVRYPYMVTYCKARHRLYVSVQKSGCDEVWVYQL